MPHHMHLIYGKGLMYLNTGTCIIQDTPATFGRRVIVAIKAHACACRLGTFGRPLVRRKIGRWPSEHFNAKSLFRRVNALVKLALRRFRAFNLNKRRRLGQPKVRRVLLLARQANRRRLVHGTNARVRKGLFPLLLEARTHPTVVICAKQLHVAIVDVLELKHAPRFASRATIAAPVVGVRTAPEGQYVYRVSFVDERVVTARAWVNRHDGVLYPHRVVPGAIVGVEFNRKGGTLANVDAFLRGV